MVRSNFLEAIDKFHRFRILVAGDVMLDRYIYGEVSRISQEAPVPVVDLQNDSAVLLLGGAANVAKNLSNLGSFVSLCGVCGTDSESDDLFRLLELGLIDSTGLIVDSRRVTTVKTRVISKNNHHVIRLDRENRDPWVGSLDAVADIMNGKRFGSTPQAVIVSDYAKGFVTRDLLNGLRERCADLSIPLVIDPKIRNHGLYDDAFLVTPNSREASKLSGIEIHDQKTLELAGNRLIDELRCEWLLITTGSQGMTLFGKNGTIWHIPAVAQKVYDVTGAGDTVVAMVTLGILAGLDVPQACELANIAAGVVVGDVGTSAISMDQLMRVL